MKTRLELAHDYSMLHMMNPQYKEVDDLEMVQWAFDYADAMLAENEKRSGFVQGGYQTEKPKYEHAAIVAVGDDWQPDWSVAPNCTRAWEMCSCGNKARWLLDERMEYACVEAPSFNYQGDWRNSLRKRPDGE